MRTDVHAPKSFDPSQYEFVGFVYIGPITDEMWQDPSDPDTLDYIRVTPHAGVYGLGQCDHCGARHLYCWIFEYQGPGKQGWISVGGDCAHGRFQCPDRATFELATLKRKVASIRDYGKKSAAVREALAANPGLAEAAEWTKDAEAHLRALADAKQALIDAGDEDSEAYADACREHNTAARMIGWNVATIQDIVSKLFRYGGVTEKQAAFAAKLAVEGAAKQAKAKQVAEEIGKMEPLKAGRQELRGVVKSVKLYESLYGNTWKWVVTLPTGHAVFGSIPSADEMYEEAVGRHGTYADMNVLRGCEVSFTATVDPSVGDNDFAVYKRPAKPTLHTVPTA